ncbi:MAG TPA: IS200/IS605 family transposase [Myxococcales bacterium]|jgi:REP element-mobilizing transposase RayT
MPFHQLYLHMTFATAQRKPLITLDLEQRLWAAVASKSKDLGCEVLAVGGMPDHVHLLTELPPTLPVSDLAQGVKGASAHLMVDELAPKSGFLWQEGYGAFTLRKDEVAAVVRYIANQKELHLLGKLSKLMERAN